MNAHDAEREAFNTACHHFDHKEYFEAHEVWEDIWNEASGPRRHFLQGLIQVAVALHHSENFNWVGMRKLFSSGLNYLELGKTVSDSIDIEELKNKVVEFAIAVQKYIPDTQAKGPPIAGGEMDLPYFVLPRKGN